MADIRFNPVPHNMTRPPRTSWQNYTESRITPSGYSIGQLKSALAGSVMGAVGSTVQEMISKTSNSSYLGTITTAHVDGPLSVADDGSATPSSWKASDRSLWGCRFHYNPPGVMLSAGVDNTIDATTLNSRSANLLTPGTSSVSLELYFNRVFDMLGDPNGYSIPLGKDPVTGISQRTMILQQGTAYDIEYLFRAINGDPQADSTAMYPTADWGALTAAPVDIQLGAFQWTGMIDGLSISHGMFTPDMVPTLSSVSISMTRQITMQTNDASGNASTENPPKSDKKKTTTSDAERRAAAVAAEQKKKKNSTVTVSGVQVPSGAPTGSNGYTGSWTGYR